MPLISLFQQWKAGLPGWSCVVITQTLLYNSWDAFNINHVSYCECVNYHHLLSFLLYCHTESTSMQMIVFTVHVIGDKQSQKTMYSQVLLHLHTSVFSKYTHSCQSEQFIANLFWNLAFPGFVFFVTVSVTILTFPVNTDGNWNIHLFINFACW